MKHLKYIDKIYVLHVKQGYEVRRQSIEDQMAHFGLDFEFILDYDIGDIDSDLLSHYFHVQHRRTAYPGESLILKHIEALKKISEHQFNKVIIFEDDVILSKNFIEIVNKAMEESINIQKPHTIYLGCANNMYTSRKQIMPNQFLYSNVEGRAADSYVLGAKEAKILLNWLYNYLATGSKIDLAIDHLYNRMNSLLGVEFLWLEPTVVVQGSMNGKFPSILDKKRIKRSLFMNKINFWVNMLNRKYIKPYIKW